MTFKGNPKTSSTGFLGSVAVDPATLKVGPTIVKQKVDGTTVMFGSSFADDSTLVITDAAFGAATVKIGQDKQATVQGTAKVNGQKATCWAATSRKTKTTFVTDIGKAKIVEVDPFKAGAIVQELDIKKSPISGFIDIAVGGDFLYSIAPDNSAVLVVDISQGSGKMVEKQVLNLSNLGINLKASMGIQAFV